MNAIPGPVLSRQRSPRKTVLAAAAKGRPMLRCTKRTAASSKIAMLTSIIEELTGQLHERVKENGLSHPSVLAVSQELDTYIVQYQILLGEKKRAARSGR
jgi:Spo0E like sporulation regulatory protein